MGMPLAASAVAPGAIGAGALVAGLALVLVYYLVAWFLVRRNVEEGGVQYDRRVLRHLLRQRGFQGLQWL